MAKHVNIEHEVDPEIDEEDVRLEKTGENSYRLRTGDPSKHEFSKFENKRRRFDEKFIEQYNSVAEHSDRFDLGSRDTREVMDKVRRHISDGNPSFNLKVRE